MNTDTKAVARYRAVLSHGLIEVEANPAGSFVLFTDHERVVVELREAFELAMTNLVTRNKEVNQLNTALAASRAEVEWLRNAVEKIAQLDPQEDSEMGWNEWGCSECFHKASKIAKDAMEKRNV